MRIIDKLKEREAFTPAENQIAEFIRENSSDVVGMPLDEMADQLYVSKSTIIRFCKKLGFHGHKELCVELAKEFNAFVDIDSEPDPSVPFAASDDRRRITDKLAALNYRAVSEIYHEINQDQLYRIGRQIRDRKSVCIYASDEDSPQAASFAMKLQSIGIQAQNGPGALQSSRYALYQPADVPALMISYQGTDRFLNQTAGILSERKIPVTLICGPFAGGLKRYASELIEISFYEPAVKIASFGSSAAMSFLLDTLFAYIFGMDYEKNLTLIRTADEVKQKNSEET